jgi:biotin carboxyl carrier protein
VRLELVVDGVAQVVEVDLAAGTLKIGDRELPFRVVSAEGERAELEIAGEPVVVEGWPPHNDRPTGRLSVNGEVVRLDDLRRSAGAATPSPPPGGTAGPVPAPSAGAADRGAPGAASAGPGTPLLPPMPGKVLELRVKDGDRVEKGQVLLVLEAMKMRNEVASPAAGVVAGLAVAAGANVRAKDVLLRIVAG